MEDFGGQDGLSAGHVDAGIAPVTGAARKSGYAADPSGPPAPAAETDSELRHTADPSGPPAPAAEMDSEPRHTADPSGPTAVRTRSARESGHAGDLGGRTALVTGASRGIGRAIACRLAARGAVVFVHFGTDERGAMATVDEIARGGGTAYAVGAELAVDGDVETLLAGVEAGLGGQPLDILVNNAAAPPAGPLGGTTRAAFDHLFAVNVRAPYFLIERALPLLRDGGRIITISSVATRMANATQTSFAMTKGAVETMSRTLANQLGARGITVNAVAPGATRTATNGPVFEAPGLAGLITGMTALDRLGAPDDIADVVAFLASDAGRWITGQVIDASSGLFLGPRI